MDVFFLEDSVLNPSNQLRNAIERLRVHINKSFDTGVEPHWGKRRNYPLDFFFQKTFYFKILI